MKFPSGPARVLSDITGDRAQNDDPEKASVK